MLGSTSSKPSKPPTSRPGSTPKALQATIAAQTLAAIAQAGIKTATNIASAASSVTGSSGRNPNATTGIGSNTILGTISSIGGVESQVQSALGVAANNQSLASSAAFNFTNTTGAL